MLESQQTDHVSDQRWRLAQQWEESFWVNAQRARGRYFKNQIWQGLSALGMVPKHRGDDSNHWWRGQFEDYLFLPAKVPNAIEVGCGPYTNVRLMLDRCQIEHLYLSDPLIRTYVNFKLTFLADMYRQAACVLDDHPLEELPFVSDYFDLVVMINVLDHVRDARRCMETVVRITKPGGLLVIGQELTNQEDLAELKGAPGEVGHPIMVDRAWFSPYLDQGFTPIISKVLAREQGRSPKHHYATLVFAGKKGGA